MDDDKLVELVREARGYMEPVRGETEEWLRRLETQHDALHSLVERLLASDPPAGAETAAGLWRFWWLRGHMAEGRAFLERAVVIESPEHVEILKGLGTIAFRQGDLDAAANAFRERLEVVQSAGRQREVSDALADLARVALRRGDFNAVRDYAERGLMAAKDFGPDAIRTPVHLLAAAARMEGRFAEARALYLKSRSLSEQLGNERSVAGEDHNLLYVELHSGDRQEAERRFRSSSAWIFAHEDAYLRPYSLLDAGVLALFDDDFERSALLIASAQTLFEETASVPDPDDRVELDNAVDRLKAELGPRFEEVRAKGRKLTLAQAQELARR